jgi:hypothetical protein
MSIKFTINDYANNMDALLAINKQCAADIQQVAVDAIRIITELCHSLNMDPTTLTATLTQRLMQAHQEAMNAVQGLQE